MPGRMRGTRDHFVGRSGPLAVVAELLQRECNAAIPEVDLGSDVFAFREPRPEVVRIQVKTCTKPTAYKDQSGYSARFGIPMAQLRHPQNRPPLFYVLAVRQGDQWIDYLVISRTRLNRYWDERAPFGSENERSGDLEITVGCRQRVTCSGRDLTDCRNAWGLLPPLRQQESSPGRRPGADGG